MNGSLVNLSANDDYDYSDYYDIGQRAEVFLQAPENLLQIALSVLAIAMNAASLAALASTSATVPYSRLIASLACSDILIGATVIAHMANLIGNPLHTIDSTSSARIKSRCANIVIAGLNATAINISLLNLLGMAVDHYVAIMRPLRYPVLLSRQRSRCMIAALWCLAVVLGYSDFIVAVIERVAVPVRTRRYQLNFCEDVYWHPKYNREYATFALAFLCLIALVGVYARIYMAVRKLQSLGAAAAAGAGSSGSKKALATTLLVLGTFLVCWLPNFLCDIAIVIKITVNRASVLANMRTHYLISKYLYSLMLVNALCDPLIYALRLPDVRHSYWRLFRRAADTCRCVSGRHRHRQRRRRDGSMYTNESSLLSEERHYSQRSAGNGGATAGDSNANGRAVDTELRACSKAVQDCANV